ncbi:MAG: response regulator [Calditrichia bacterium]
MTSAHFRIRKPRWPHFSSSQFDLAFVDLKMTPIDGMVILQAFREHAPQTTVAIITAHGSIESAVEAIKNGAHDYLQKPFDYLELQIFAQKMLSIFTG